ncbi:hypothetical protein KI387_012494, partial [Taxus chinensis]
RVDDSNFDLVMIGFLDGFGLNFDLEEMVDGFDSKFDLRIGVNGRPSPKMDG